MHASIGNNSSYIWRSLIWCRELLRKGLRWRVCKGDKIATFKDQWIPGVKPQQPMDNIVANEFKTVSTLMHEGVWNVALISSLFPQYIVPNILSIPILDTHIADSRFWFLDQKGKYNVRDGYKLDIGCYNSPINSSKHKDKDW